MNLSASLCIKILSLAVVLWGVTSSVLLNVQGAAWVPWVALMLLMLLEAYAMDAKEASWSQWSVGLLRLMGPGMLPYYAVLAAFLAFGPGQLRHIAQPGPLAFPAQAGRPGGVPNQFPGHQSGPVRPTGFPGNTAPPRPTMINPSAAGQQGQKPTGAPPRSATFPVKPANGGPAQAPTQPAAPPIPSAPPPANGAVGPTSTAKPPALPGK